MTISKRLAGVLLIGILTAACSGINIVGSWLNQNYREQIKKVYIIAIAKSDFNRMYIENTYYEKLASEGVSAIPSSTDLPENKATDRATIIQMMKINNCDTVLLTRVIDQRTETGFTSPRGSYHFLPAPYYGGLKPYNRPAYYGNWDNFYAYGLRVVYQPPSTSKSVVLTVESVLYDLKTEELIWAAQMETELENNIEDTVQKFVGKAVENLKGNGLI